MYCKYCGAETSSNVDICQNCVEANAKRKSNRVFLAFIIFAAILFSRVFAYLVNTMGLTVLSGKLHEYMLEYFIGEYAVSLAWYFFGLSALIFFYIKYRKTNFDIKIQDLTFPLCICLFDLLTNIQLICVGCSIGEADAMAFSQLLRMQDSFGLTALWPWLIVLLYLVVRSQSAEIKLWHFVVCSGIFIGWSVVVYVLNSSIVSIHNDGVSISEVAKSFTLQYFALRWIQRMMIVVFAVLSSKRVISNAAGIVFSTSVFIVSFGGTLLGMFVFKLGITSAAVGVFAGIITGCLVLFISYRKWTKRKITLDKPGYAQ